MGKLLCEIDLTKIDKSKIEDKTYTNKEGQEVTKKVYKFEIVQNKQAKVLKETDTYILEKTHFIVEGQTKEEKDRKAESNFIGEGIQFKYKNDNQSMQEDYNQDIEPSSIPF